jgi:hypothetical protein
MVWLPVDQVCERLGVSRNTWNTWRAGGRTPRRKRLTNAQLRVREDWLDAWFAAPPGDDLGEEVA